MNQTCTTTSSSKAPTCLACSRLPAVPFEKPPQRSRGRRTKKRSSCFSIQTAKLHAVFAFLLVQHSSDSKASRRLSGRGAIRRGFWAASGDWDVPFEQELIYTVYLLKVGSACLQLQQPSSLILWGAEHDGQDQDPPNPPQTPSQKVLGGLGNMNTYSTNQLQSDPLRVDPWEACL